MYQEAAAEKRENPVKYSDAVMLKKQHLHKISDSVSIQTTTYMAMAMTHVDI
jgi:hypothetical protein